MKIEDVESQLEQGISKLKSPQYESLQSVLGHLIPLGYRPRVSLFEKGRKKRKSAAAENWSHDSGEIRISFEPATATAEVVAAEMPAPIPTSANPTLSQSLEPRGPITDLVRALERAEARPGYKFVALKWFRDIALPAEGFDWTQSASGRQNVLRQAIDRRLVLTSKIPNPKSPEFPVTAIRLNRVLPEVQAILGEAPTLDSDFRPAEIRGEGLSATIRRDRR